MIEVTKINGVKVLVNPDLIELVEETPDTVLTLTTGKKIIVKESRQEIKNLVIFKTNIHIKMIYLTYKLYIFSIRVDIV